MQAVGQAGQRIVHGLVGEPLFGAQALANLPEQFVIDLGQLAGALVHAFFQLGVRIAQPLLVTLAGQPVADVLGHEGEQALVVRGEAHLRRVALHHDHPDHIVVAEQWHAQPAVRARTKLTDPAGGPQRVDVVARGQQRLAVAHDELGQPLAERARRARRVVLIHRVDEIQPVAGLVDQGDVEIARVQQRADHPVHLHVELGQAFGAHRHLGDVEQRQLQLLGASALDHFVLQAAIGALQLQRAPLHLTLQLHLRLAPVHRGEDVLGHITQQGAVGLVVAHALLVALHHDGTAHPALAQHRHAHPVQALRPTAGVVLVVHRRQQLVGRPAQRLAVAQQREGEAARHFMLFVAAVRVGLEGVALVGEIQEAHPSAHIVVLDDVAVLRVHQRIEHAVEMPQHFGHFQVRTGQVGNLVQRLLQPLGGFQGLDLLALAGQRQRVFQRLACHGPPARVRHRARRGQRVHGQLAAVMLPSAQRGLRPGHAAQQRVQQFGAGRGAARVRLAALAQPRVRPRQRHLRLPGQQCAQRLRKRSGHHCVAIRMPHVRHPLAGQHVDLFWHRIPGASPVPGA
ncbi:hypothetical protein D3C71_888360 [compost metagenome]